MSGPVALLPCPFCGGTAEYARIGNRRRSTIVSCNECGASLETGEEWGQGRAWNKRHRLPHIPVEPTEAMVQAGIRACVLERDHLADEGVREIYRAMVQAAPPLSDASERQAK